MSTESQPVQAQAAPPESSPVVAAPSKADVNAAIDSLFTANITGASAAGKADLQTQLLTALTPQAAASEPPAVEPKEQQPPEPAPAGDQPPAEPTPEPETVPPVDPPAGDDAEPSDRIRLGSYSDEDRSAIQAAHILAKGQKISFAEAFSRVTGTNAPQQQAQPEPQTPAIPPHLTALETEVAEIEAKMTAAGVGEGLFNPEVSALIMQLSKANAKLEAQRAAFESTGSVRGEVDEAMFMRQRGDFEAQAKREFPDASKRDSLLFMTAVAMGKEIADNPNHPLYSRMVNGVDAPMVLLDAAAQRLEGMGQKVARASKPVVPSAPQPAKPQQASPSSQPPRPSPVAPGSRGTVPQPNVTAQDIIKAGDDLLASVLNGGAKVNQANRRFIIT